MPEQKSVVSKERTKVRFQTFNGMLKLLQTRPSEDKTVMEGHKSDGMLRLAEIIH